MINSSARLALLSSVSTVMAVCLLPGTAQAQATTCSQAGLTINCVDGATPVLTGTVSAGTTTVAGPGLVTANTTTPATITYTGAGPIATTGVGAVNLTSTGGALSFVPTASGPAVAIRTVGGAGANGLTLNTLGQSATATVGNIATSGTNSFGVLSTAGTDLTLRTGNITTTGLTSTAVDAGAQTGSISIQTGDISATGRGLRTVASNSGTNTITVGNVVTGDRGILANGGTVSVTAGTITTSTNGGTTPGGYGVAAQAFTGNSTVRTGAISTTNGAGIVAVAFSATGAVDVGGCPTVSTAGNNATAISAQSGGTGSVTINCGALTTTGDNSNGVFSTSNGGNIVANIASATTAGVGSYGLTANTTGAGNVTVNGGVITTTGVGSTGLFSRAGTGTIDVGYGNITTSGIGSGGNTANALDLVSTGAINLRGAGATLRTNGAGVTAAVITGAGVTGNLGNVTTTGFQTQGAIITSSAPVALTIGTVNTTSSGVVVNAGANDVTLTTGDVNAGGNGVAVVGGAVNLTTGAVRTSTNNGAGFGGTAVSVQAQRDVTVRTGAISTQEGAGILATSQNGSIDIGGCPTVSTTGNTFGAGVGPASAIQAQAVGTGSVTINCGVLSTTGLSSHGVLAMSNGGNITANITSATTSGTGSTGLFAVTSGTGTVTTNAGVITTTGAGSSGLLIRAGTGAIDAGYGNITTSGINDLSAANALQISSLGTVNVRGTGATLRTNGAGVTAAQITSAGITGNLGNVTTTGAGSQGAIITSTAPVNLVIGNVATTNNGVVVNAGANAVTLATGTVTATEAGATGTVINATGPISFTGGRQTANGANALLINGGAGAINVNLAGAATTGTATAVNILGTGPLTFVNNAAITTTGATSTGLNIAGVTTANVTCGNVSTTGAASPAVVVAANGTTNVTCGTVTTTGAASDAILVSNTAGTTTVTGGTTSATGAGSRGIVVTSSAPAASGLVTVNSGVVTANGNAVAASSTGGANVVINATGNVTSTTGTGLTATTAGTTLVTIGAGTTTTGVQGANLQGTAGNTLVVNGTLRNTAGTTPYTVRNGGPFTLTLGSTGSIVGPLVFTTGNDTFNNQGTFALPALLDFGAGTDVLNNSGTLTAFTGTSTIANLETFNNVGGLIDMRDGTPDDSVVVSGAFVGSGASRLSIDFNNTTSDRLVIGGAASGTTTVNANFVGTGLLNVPGVLVVDGSTAGPAAFALGTVGGNTSPLVDYNLAQVGADYFITAAPNASAFDPVAIASLAPTLWYQSADEVFAQTDQPAVTVGTSFWGQAYYSQDKYGESNDHAVIGGTSFDVNNRVDTKRMGLQGGVDYGFGGARVGLTGGYGQAKADNDLNNRIKATGWNVGAYGQFGGYTGFHGAGLVKYDRYKLRFESGAFNGDHSRLTALGVDGSLGYRFGIGAAATLDAKAGLSHVRSKVDDINAFGFNYDIGRVTSTRGRAGLRATFGNGFAPYVDATVYREFNGRRNVALFDGLNSYDLGSNGKGTWARLEAGISSNGGPGPLVAAWADLGDKKGFGIRAGFRFGGRAIAEVIAPPPPPAAPIAPPPATQTCSDGSVILATDLCPVLAPPPAPPAPEAQPERG